MKIKHEEIQKKKLQKPHPLLDYLFRSVAIARDNQLLEPELLLLVVVVALSSAVVVASLELSALVESSSALMALSRISFNLGSMCLASSTSPAATRALSSSCAATRWEMEEALEWYSETTRGWPAFTSSTCGGRRSPLPMRPAFDCSCECHPQTVGKYSLRSYIEMGQLTTSFIIFRREPLSWSVTRAGESDRRFETFT